MRIGNVLLSGALLLAPLTAGASPKPPMVESRDFTLVRAPAGKKDRCSPIFFCRTGGPETSKGSRHREKRAKHFTKERQVKWCYRYAAAILGKKNVKRQLVLVQIEPEVNLTRLKQLALTIAGESKCRGSWPINKIKLTHSASTKASAKSEDETSAASALSAPLLARVEAQTDPEEQRGVVLLQPGDEYTNPEVAAATGPPYANRAGDYVAKIEDIPSEEDCACSSSDQDQEDTIE